MDAFTSLYRRRTADRDPDDAYRYVRSCVLNGARSQLRRRRVTEVEVMRPVVVGLEGAGIAGGRARWSRAPSRDRVWVS